MIGARIALPNGTVLATVSDAMIDPVQWIVLAFGVQPDSHGAPERVVPWEAAQAWRPPLLIVLDDSDMVALQQLPGVAHRAARRLHWGCPVRRAVDGRWLGTLEAAQFDWHTGRVHALSLRPPSHRTESLMLPAPAKRSPAGPWTDGPTHRNGAR